MQLLHQEKYLKIIRNNRNITMTWYPRCQGWCHRPETVSLASSCIRPRGPGARNRVPKVWNRAQVFQTQLFEAKRLFSMDVRWFSKAVFKSVTSNEPHSCSSNQSLRFHNHCNYIVVLGIGVTWHSHMSNASKGCHEISRVLSSYAGPGRRCINAMWQYQIGCLHSCDIHHSVFSPKKWPSATPSKHMDQGGFEPAEGPFMWMDHFSQKPSKW